VERWTTLIEEGSMITNNLIYYLIVLGILYSIFFIVYYKIVKYLEKARQKKDIELANNKKGKISNKDFKQIDKMFIKIEQKRKKEIIRNFYISLTLSILLIILIIISICNNLKLNTNRYLFYLYYIIPIMNLYFINDAIEYIKNRLLKHD
jgi:hypothetical protein